MKRLDIKNTFRFYLSFLFFPLAIILYLISFFCIITYKLLDRLSLLLPISKQNIIQPLKQVQQEKSYDLDSDLNELLDPESDMLMTLLDDSSIRSAVLDHLEECYNYKIKRVNEHE